MVLKILSKSTEILGMALEKSKIQKRMESWSDLVAQHLAKCAMYGDSLHGDKYNHWVEEIATYISDINDTLCKHNNKKLKPIQYENGLFGWLSDSSAEAKSNIHDLQLHNRKTANPYPYVEVDDDMITRMTEISKLVIEVFVPLLASINSITKPEIESKLHEILDPVCKRS